MNTATIDATEMNAPTANASEVGNNLSRDARLDAASKIISDSTKWSAVASVIPVPTLDMLAIAAVQAKLVGDLSKLYGSSFTNESVKAIVSALLGTLVPAGATSVVVSTSAKYIPGYGSVIGLISLAGFSSAATYAIGKVFVRHFENGGTLADFSPEAVKADLKNEFQKASK
jgi:uncharacterized protein (DUF697 family)